MDSQAHGAGSKRSRDETVDPNAEESSVWESFLDQIGMERDLNEEPEQECEGDERSEERHKNITDYERKFIVECIEEVSHISSSVQAWKRFDTSNVKSWLFWPRWVAGAEKEAFYARAVGLWYPAKWFPEMRNTIYCPRCETQVDVENGTWMKPEQAREVVSFERTWLLLGREYRCPNARCGYNFRNTTVEFLKSCPELARHRFPIIIRKKLAIERTLAQFYYPLWIRSGQIPLDASLGAHVRNFEKTREMYYLSHIQAADPEGARMPPKLPRHQTIPGMFAQQQEKNDAAGIELPTSSHLMKEAEAERLAGMEVQNIPTKFQTRGFIPPKVVKGLTKVSWRPPGAMLGEDNQPLPLRMIDFLKHWDESFCTNHSGNDSWCHNNIKGDGMLVDSPGKVVKSRLCTAMKNAVAYLDKVWKHMTQLSVLEVEDLLKQKKEREERNKEKMEEFKRKENLGCEVSAAKAQTAERAAPPLFGDFDDAKGFNGFKLGRFFLDDVCIMLFNDNARAQLRELVSAPAQVLRIDCTFNFASKVRIKLRNEKKKISTYQPFIAIMTVANELNQIVWYQGLRDGEHQGGELRRALENFNEVRQQLQPGYSPKVIYTDNCCNQRKDLQAIWPGVIVKLDAFHWLNRFRQILEPPPSHPLRKAFSIALSNAIYSPDRKHLEVEEEGKNPEPTISKPVPRSIPDKEEIRNRVIAVLFSFLRVDSKSDIQNCRIDFAKNCSKWGQSIEDFEKTIHETLRNTEQCDILRAPSPKHKTVKLFKKKTAQGKTWAEFFKVMLKHIDDDCLSDPDGVDLNLLLNDGSHRTARGEGANERFHRIMNEFILNASIGLVRADAMLLYIALKHNRLRASEIKPLHSSIPRVDIHTSMQHRLRINSLVLDFFPQGPLPFSDHAIPAAIDPSLSLGLALLPLLGTLGSDDSSLTKAGATGTALASNGVEIAKVQDFKINSSTSSVIRNSNSIHLLEQTWAMLIGMTWGLQNDLHSLISGLLYRIAANQKLAGEPFVQSEFKQRINIGILSTSIGARFAILILSEVSSYRKKPIRECELKDVLEYFCNHLGSTTYIHKHPMLLEVLSVSNTGGVFNTSTLRARPTPKKGYKYGIEYHLHIGHLIAPTRGAVHRPSKLATAPSAIFAREDAGANSNAFSYFERCLGGTKVNLAYASRNYHDQSCAVWFSFKLSPARLLQEKSVNKVQYEHQLATLAQGESILRASHNDALQPTKKHRRPTSRDIDQSNTPFAIGPSHTLDETQRAERDLFLHILNVFRPEFRSTRASEKSFTAMTQMWNFLVEHPHILEGIKTGLSSHQISHKREDDIRSMARRVEAQNQVPYNTKESIRVVQKQILLNNLRTVSVKNTKNMPIQLRASPEQVSQLLKQAEDYNEHQQEQLLRELCGASSFLGQLDSTSLASNRPAESFLSAPLLVLHNTRQDDPQHLLDIPEVSIGANKKSWRSIGKLSSRYFCSKCSRRIEGHGGVTGDSCVLTCVSWTDTNLSSFPRDFFREYPMYRTLPLGTKLSDEHLSNRSRYVCVLLKLKTFLGPKFCLPINLAHFTCAVRREQFNDIQIKLLLDHANIGSSRSSHWVSNFLMDLYLKVLRLRQARVEKLTRSTIFVGGNFTSVLTMDRWCSELRYFFRSSNEAGEFSKKISASNCSSLDLLPPGAKLILFPFLKDSHWCLMIVDFVQRRLFGYDPMKASSGSCFEDCQRSLDEVLRIKSDLGEWKFEFVAGKQENSYDCGIYVMAMMDALSSGGEVHELAKNIEPSSAPQLRISLDGQVTDGRQCCDLRRVRDLQMLTFEDVLQDSVNFSRIEDAESYEEIQAAFTIKFGVRQTLSLQEDNNSCLTLSSDSDSESAY